MPVQEVPTIRVVRFNRQASSGKTASALSPSLCDTDDPPPCVCDNGPCSSEHCIDICSCESETSPCPCEAVSVPPPCSCDNDDPSSSGEDTQGKIEVKYRYKTAFKIADGIEVGSKR